MLLKKLIKGFKESGFLVHKGNLVLGQSKTTNPVLKLF